MDHNDPAASRYWLLQLARLGGLVLVIIGTMILAGRIDQPQAVGAALFVLGAVDFFLVPVILARRWKRQDP